MDATLSDSLGKQVCVCVAPCIALCGVCKSQMRPDGKKLKGALQRKGGGGALAEVWV